MINEKRQHLEKGLSARQRDARLLLSEAKEDSAFRREMCSALKESNKVFADTMTTMGNSFAQKIENTKKTMEHLSNMNQNLPMSHAHTPERYFHGNTNHMFVQPSSSSPQIYSSADLFMQNRSNERNDIPANFGSYRSFLEENWT